MSKIKIITVTEGPSDISIIEKISNYVAKKEGKEVEILPLAPAQDKTSSNYESFGWTGVKRWCKKYNSNKPQDNTPLARAARRKTIKALLAYADYLIIQLDTDIAQDLQDLPESFNPNNDCRKEYTKKTILNWLHEDEEPENTYLLLSTYSIENWILATYPPEHEIFSDAPQGFDYEAVENPEELLIRTGQYKTKIKNGRQRLKKNRELYLSYGDLIVSEINSAKDRCGELEKYIEKTRNFIQN